MDKTDTRPGNKARLVSPYINTTGKCLELFYWIRELPPDDVETNLKVIAITEEHTEEELHLVSDLTAFFPRVYVRLPKGTYRIAVEGHRSFERKFCAVSLDDVTIMDCERFGKIYKFHKYASCSDWRISPHAHRRHRQRRLVCRTWLTTVQCIIDFSLFGLGG